MISIQAYRIVIGSFLGKARFLSAQQTRSVLASKEKSKAKSRKNKIFERICKNGQRKIGHILILICFIVVLRLVNTIILDGDVESNPGPTYNIEKSVQGSYHQGDQQFGDTAGVQCACNSLYALAWSQIRKVYLWNTLDLDHILVEGDCMYKMLNTFDMLSVDELPRTVTMYDHNLVIEFLDLKTELARLVDGDPFLRNIVPDGDNILFLLFMGGNTTAVISSGSFFYVFDSHSRDEIGLSVADGTSVLLKFKYLFEMEKYIQVAYLEYRDIEQLYFQVQFIRLNIRSVDKSTIHSKHLKNTRLRNYKRNSTGINKRKRQKYSEIVGTSTHKKLKAKMRCYSKQVNYTIIGTPKHENIKERKKIWKQKKDTKKSVGRVSEFKIQTKEGPFFICVVCHRCLYNQSVILFKTENYEDVTALYPVSSYNDLLYICKTCDKMMRKNCIPCQAVSNKLDIVFLPKEFESIRRLERVLVSRRILFKKVTIMPKGKSPKMKGSLCNIPVNEVYGNCQSLPRPADSNGLLIVKLKRKAEYRSHVLFEPVRPIFIERFLNFLKCNNDLYSDIEIDLNNVPLSLTDFQNEDLNNDNEILSELVRCPNEPIDIICETPVDGDFLEDPLAEFRAPSAETTVISEIPSATDIEEAFVVAPGEGKKPVSVLNDEFCEELAHPHLFPTGKFGYKAKREIQISPSRYFNQRLLNYSQKFASDSDYIFFAHSVLQRVQLNSQINIAMRKVASSTLTAGMLSRNFKQTVKEFIARDKAYSFMNPIKGTPAYWKKFFHEVLAMVKQLGIPTFFLTLSCADLRWDELISIISKLNGLNISEEDINQMSYHERCDTLNKNPVLLARHFQYRVELFFKIIVLDGPLGKTKYYAIRVEFQVRGSPHVHSFIWILNSPKLTKNNTQEYITWVDSIIRTDLPDPSNEPELFELVKTFQIHRHSRTCRKYRNKKCRFSFGKFFTERTIIAQPLPDSISIDIKNEIMQNRKQLLKKVKNYIDTELNPSKKNFYDSSRDDYEDVKSIGEILGYLEISKCDYEQALAISDDNDFQIHFKRMPNSCFVNNYFCDGLMAWEANLDIQPVFNQYKAVAYMCAYLSKSEDECSLAMTQAVRDAFEKDLDNYEQMKSVANAYINKRECSVQECVYHVLPGQWLRKTFPGVIFANSNVPEKRFRIFLSENEITDLPEDSKDVFKRNMVDRYIDRPNETSFGGKYSVLDSMCYAEFSRFYCLAPKAKFAENDYQPEELVDELLEPINNIDHNYPKLIPLMSSKEKLKCRKVPYVLQFYVPNQQTKPEEYAHHMLFMYYPFRSENELKSGSPQTYADKLRDPEVVDVVNQNRVKVEPFATIVDDAFERFTADLEIGMDPFGQQENDETYQELGEQLEEVDTDNCETEDIFSHRLGNADLTYHPTLFFSDEVISENIRSLNVEQRKVFDVVHKWSRDYIKSLHSKVSQTVNPFYIFLTGGGGVGKSHLIKTIFMSISKVLLYKGSDPEKPRILLLAPTGVAAININGTTIHSGLQINVGGKMFPLGDSQRAILRNRLSEVKMIIIDEISMVSSVLFYQVNQRLNEIFGYSDKSFAGFPVLVCGDFFQLPPVRGLPVYSSTTSVTGFLTLDLWQKFNMIELTEVMRQREDFHFINVLNKIRVGEIHEDVEVALKSRFVDKNQPSYPENAVHIFAENKPVEYHNEAQLHKIDNQLVSIIAIDEIPRHIKLTESQIEGISQRKLSETGNLAHLLKLKIGAQVMLTANVNIEDRLVNGLVGRVMEFKKVNNETTVIYVKFNDEKAGLIARQSDCLACQQQWVPIKKHEVSFGLKKNKLHPCIKRTQFPLSLSWACTVHKVQGLSLDEGVISFDLHRQKSFNQGQMYVALSRIKSMSKMYLVGNYSKTALKVNLSAKNEYQRLRRESRLNALLFMPVSEFTFNITLLNTRSLRKHFVDIIKDKHLLENDVLCLTETQLHRNEDTSHIESNFQEHFKMHFNSSENKHRSIAFCYSNDVSLLAYEDYNAISILTFFKPHFYEYPITIALLYRSPDIPLNGFIDELIYFVNGRNIDILVGDFNIDAFNDNVYARLRDILSNYRLLVKEPTHLDGGLLDHVYLHKSFPSKSEMTIVKNIYFSDHDAVKFQLSLKSSIREDIDFSIGT